MARQSRHLSVYIGRPVSEVYAFLADPTNLPRWARGLGGAVVEADGAWFVETAQGRARVTFAPHNAFGVLDHEVVTPDGEVVHVPLRAVADGDGCEVVFTLRRTERMTDAEFERDAALVTADLAHLGQLLEGGAG